MADIQVGGAIHINGQMEKNQEKEEIQEVAIQIDDPLKATTTEKSQKIAEIESEEIQEVVAIEKDDQSENSTETSKETTEIESEEIQEVAIEKDDQSENSTETSKDLAVPIDKLEIYLKKLVNELPGGPFDRRDATIFRLPSSIHENKKELCEPNLVAIGPYHHGKESLRTMEEHKWYTFRKFLARNEDVGIEDYLKVMRSIEVKARNCYSETVDLGSDDFVKMMLLDSFFILEWAFMEKNNLINGDFCDLGWACELLSNLCLLENQVPFFVLHELWVIQNHRVMGYTNCEDHYCPLLELFGPILENMLEFIPFKTPPTSCDNIYHFLHLCYLGVVPNSEPQNHCEKKRSSDDIVAKVCRAGCFLGSKLYSKSGKVVSTEPNDCAPMNMKFTIPTVSELHDAGVRFKRKKSPANMLDISFMNGTIEIPFLRIQVDTTRILWNVVAFEQSCIPWRSPQKFSSYLSLMDTLVNTDNDIAILERFGILENIFENAEEAAAFFNQFDKYFSLSCEHHYFKGLFQDVRKYTQSTWPKYRARLIKEYFNNPWSIISVVAAGILLILTFVQTYYSAAK